ncbi:MAG: HNH endonuclease, partial [Cyanobacteria bacterium P01_A01_bin.135]
MKQMLDAISKAKQQLETNVDNTIAAAKQAAESAVTTGTDALQQAQQSIDQTAAALEAWQAAIAGLGTSGALTANALKDLPRTAQLLAEEMPTLARRLQTAGIRIGEEPRLDTDVMGLFNKIPGTSKLKAS